MGLTNFRAQDFNNSKDSNVKMASSKRDRLAGPVETTTPIDQNATDPNAVPAGTVPEVLTWVGDDKDRAELALAEENANEKPRKGLVTALNDLIATDEDVVEEEEADEADSDETKNDTQED